MQVTHISSATITHAFGDAKVGFSPHDVRRTFSAAMRARGFTVADVGLILDHNETETTVDTHYSVYRDLPRKREMMTLWWRLLAGEETILADEWAEITGQRRRVPRKAA